MTSPNTLSLLLKNLVNFFFLSYIEEKKQYLKEKEIQYTDFKKSKIKDCTIKKGIETIKRKPNPSGNWTNVLNDVNSALSRQEFMATTTFKYAEGNLKGVKGFRWREGCGFSTQNKDTPATFKEIVDMVKKNKMTIDMSIQKADGKIVHFKIE